MTSNASPGSSPHGLEPSDSPVSPSQSRSGEKKKKKPKERNAFSELMTRKPQQQQRRSEEKAKGTRLKSSNMFKARDALGAYIKDPASFYPSAVLYYDDDFVAIRDRFPKSTLHILLLPREPDKSSLHPFDAFEDPEFLRKVQAETMKLRSIAAAELRRMYGKFSAQDRVREEALNADPPPDELPAGRDWEAEIMCGIHAHPSMNHLHIHVLSVDRHSACLKHRKHYNSFATPFFIDVNDFPLARDDVRRHPGKEGYLQRDFRCWRCGREFGNRFTMLKEHLEEEFEEWKKV
ncbi:hypothetical protein AJ80_08956 [Polytolypa hystricis UAMH7299]|uniref:Aprataxin-like protein n=1 Tax=Polytolypa hystricis (strain UAMH7299) TaxID=1447883 RepID=A0A2B7WYW5_POLH7|nr:hypothetical protein AJ80_08956 [Polytolypa hystricis UAMH7299]